MGKWKLKNPELSMGPDSSSSINLAYLKLPRWRSRCRFSTPFSFEWKICHGKSSTEQAGISASMTFVIKVARKFWQINTHVTKGSERHAHDYINRKFIVSGPSPSAHTNLIHNTYGKWLLFSIDCLPLILTSCTKEKIIHRACPIG